MAQAVETNNPAGKPAAVAKRGGGRRIDFATLGGIALALTGIVGGFLMERGSIHDIAQGTAAMIVLGGTFGAVLVTNSLPVVIRAFKALGNVLFERTGAGPEIMESLIHYAAKARKNGIVSLESEAAAIADPFLRKALNLAVDGTDLQEIRKMMEVDISLSEQAAEAEAKVWESAGGYAPTIGIIGAVLGLIQVMKNLEDIKEVGQGIAVAFVATVYGLGTANLFYLPAASKLRGRMREAALLKDMTLEGVVGIVEGLNPTLIRMKLESYIQDPGDTRKKKAGKGERGVEPAAKAGPEAPPASAAAGGLR
jgi:chemotaxis protein MotA